MASNRVSDNTGSYARDHLANERTQLAWLRTSANVIVVGLAVARFADGGEVTAASLVAGGVLILTGAVGVVNVALAAWLLLRSHRGVFRLHSQCKPRSLSASGTCSALSATRRTPSKADSMIGQPCPAESQS